MAKACDHVLAAYQSEHQITVVVAEEVEALVRAAPWCSGLLAHDLEYLPRDVHASLSGQVAEIKRMLYRFMQSLSSSG